MARIRIWESLQILSIYIHFISGHKWSTTHRVLKSHRSKMSVIYIRNHEKKCALVPGLSPTMALWQLMHLGTWCTSCTSCAQVHELPQSHCGDNREGTLFSWLRIIYLLYAEKKLKSVKCSLLYQVFFQAKIEKKTINSFIFTNSITVPWYGISVWRNGMNKNLIQKEYLVSLWMTALLIFKLYYKKQITIPWKLKLTIGI